jgi:heme-degrading monooxygenase HmoA
MFIAMSHFRIAPGREGAVEEWTESESLRKAQVDARAPKGTRLERPKFEGFEVVL